MSAREEVCLLAHELSEEDLRVVARMLRGLQQASAERKLDAETQAWLDADLTPELPPYDWGDMDPMTAGEPVWYVPGVGFVSGSESER